MNIRQRSMNASVLFQRRHNAEENRLTSNRRDEQIDVYEK